MKELSIEEKAKRYDKALEVLHKYDGANIMFSQSLKEEMFPELKESEDKRIRDMIFNCVYQCCDDGFISVDQRNNAISWLEKQGEHANFINKIQIGDKVTRNEDGALVNLSQLKRVAKKDEKQGEQNPVPDWMPKFLDELRSKKNYFNWDEHKDIEGQILAIIKWMNPNYFNGKDSEQKPDDKVEPKFKVGDLIKLSKEPKYPAREIISIKNNGYYFDSAVYLPFKRQDDWELVGQKPAWSKEDETNLNDAIEACKAQYGNMSYTADWLLSLKDRVQPQPKQEWKPSKEQIMALRWVLSTIPYNMQKEEISGLLGQIKDL